MAASNDNDSETTRSDARSSRGRGEPRRTSARRQVAPDTVSALRRVSANRSHENRLGLDSTILGRYKILEVLGRGAFSVVYRAAQTGVGRIVALKVFKLSKPVDDPELIERAQSRFHQEARLASTLRHPNSVVLYDYDRTDTGILYMAFEYIEGPTLDEAIVEATNGMPPHRVIHIARQIVASLQEAHDQGIIHRDLKPGNIMLTRHGDDYDFVKVLDFGIAKLVEDTDNDPLYEAEHTDELAILDLTHLKDAHPNITLEGKIIGTPRYIPPEQIVGEQVGPASDIYSLGLVMYEMLSGVPANPNRHPMELVRWHLEGRHFNAPDGFRLPAGLAAIIQRCTSPNPAGRYQSARELARDLAELDGTGNVQPRRSGIGVPTMLAVNGLLIIALFAAFVYWVQSGDDEPDVSVVTPADELLLAELDEPEKDDPSEASTSETKDPDDATTEGADNDEISANESEPTAEEVTANPDVDGKRQQILVTSEPSGANVYLGKMRVGVTPFKMTLDPNQTSVNLKLWRKGYHSKHVRWRAGARSSPFPVKLEPYTFGAGDEASTAGTVPAAKKEEPKKKDDDGGYFIVD